MANNPFDKPSGDGVALKPEVTQPKLPSMFKVLLLNDDYTPMDFVVDCIERFFNKTREQATKLMLKVHTEGMAICGIYPQDIAETKMELVLQYAQEAGHPLQCIVEPV